MTGVEADTADVNLPGCRMEFMISTYANWPPYLHIHPICRRKERRACSAQVNLETVAFCAHPDERNLITCSRPNKGLCRFKIGR